MCKLYFVYYMYIFIVYIGFLYGIILIILGKIFFLKKSGGVNDKIFINLFWNVFSFEFFGLLIWLNSLFLLNENIGIR